MHTLGKYSTICLFIKALHTQLKNNTKLHLFNPKLYLAKITDKVRLSEIALV